MTAQSLSWGESRALVSSILARLETWGHQNTADAVRLVLAAGAPISLKALSEGRWTVELRQGPEEIMRLQGAGSFGAPLRIKDLDARALLRSPDRRTAITTVTAGLHLKRWREAASAVGISSDTPADALRPSRMVQRTASGPPNEPRKAATRSAPLKAAPEVLDFEGGDRGEAFAVASMLEAQGSSETAKWLLG